MWIFKFPVTRTFFCQQLCGIDDDNRLGMGGFVSSLDDAVEVHLGNCGREPILVLFEIEFKFNIVSIQLQAHFRWAE